MAKAFSNAAAKSLVQMHDANVKRKDSNAIRNATTVNLVLLNLTNYLLNYTVIVYNFLITFITIKSLFPFALASFLLF